MTFDASNPDYACNFIQQTTAARIEEIAPNRKIEAAEKWIEATGLDCFDSQLGVMFEVSVDAMQLRVKYDHMLACGEWDYSSEACRESRFSLDDFQAVLDLFAKTVRKCGYCETE